tara:strand:- start:597 stop:1187 length:591 start_codon:yes stop_codon:yes gene_type:complete
MALATSGTMSIGGTTATRSINLELGLSATTSSNMNSAALRGLAGVSSGAISLSNFYGKSNVIILQSLSIQNGTYTAYQGAYPQIASDAFWGILTPPVAIGWVSSVNNYSIAALFWELYPANGYTQLQFTLGPNASQANSGFTAMNITDSGGTTRSYQRSASTYSFYNGFAHWRWPQTLAPTNPMGASGSISTITIT